MQWLKYLALGAGSLLFAAAGFFTAPAVQYLSGMNSVVPELTELTAVPEQEIVISNTALKSLLAGTITLDEFEAEAGKNLTSAKRDESSVVQQKPEGSAASESTAEGDTVPLGGSAPSDNIAAADSATSTPVAEDAVAEDAAAEDAAAEDEEEPYENEIKALIQQLYVVRSSAMNGLNACIGSAKAEYKALPEEQQTQAKKIAVCLSKAGQLKVLQSSCDKEVAGIVSQMRKVLQENGQSTALADQVESTYQSQKSAMYSSLISQLYG